MLCLFSTFPVNSGDEPTPKLTAADRVRLSTIARQAEDDLRNNVIPYAMRLIFDDEYGGFLDAPVVKDGKRTSDATVSLVNQTRMIWALSSAHRWGVEDPQYMEMARKGVEFLTSKMWDTENEGFYMSVNFDGTPASTAKYVYAQAFAIYGLAEYAMASGDGSALAWAARTYDMCVSKAGDGDIGFHEDFSREWRRLPMSYGVGDVPSCKTLNTHMHMMEALTTLTDASGEPRHKAALAHITDLLLARTIDHTHGCAMEPFSEDWQPTPDGQGRITTFYGHNVEFAWLLVDAYRALGRPRKSIEKVVLAMIDNALAYGVDHERGGIARVGPYDRPVVDTPAYAGDLTKEWWEQAEAMVAYTEAFQWTSGRRYFEALDKQWDWTWDRQIDHTSGGWIRNVTWDGSASSGPIIDCYHNGRCLMRIVTAIKSLLGEHS